MRRIGSGGRGDTRSSALWGTGSKGGESRSSALWGKGGRGTVVLLALASLLVIPLAASAGHGAFGKGSAKRVQRAHLSKRTFVTPGLLKAAQRHPNKLIRVIIQSTGGTRSASSAFNRVDTLDGWDREGVRRRLALVDGVAVRIESNKLAALQRIPGLTVTPDAPALSSGTGQYSDPYSNQLWPYEANLAKTWGSQDHPAPKTPTIAVIDSGIEAGRRDFAGRIVASVNLATLPNNSAGDGRGHGTFVAGIAVGAAEGYAGANPNANLAMVDVMNDSGVARTSDVIAGCQWALANKDTYGIRVVNLSLHASNPSNFTRDPLDKAVEALWFNGVVVVAAAGNYGSAAGPSGVKYAPGNDPFVITVGAADIGGTLKTKDDTAAPWSAYGYTYDGFWKPELGAPGRYMVGPIPAGSTLAAEKAANLAAPGYIQLSGTSFAAPAVAGAAAAILARHPGFTPDQVKGALMLTAKAVDGAGAALGVGELNAAKATDVASPPNPNAALNRFIATDPLTGERTFDGAAWFAAAKASVAWDDVAWGDAAAWSGAAWSLVAWGDVAWGDVAWQDAMTSAAVAWGDVAWLDVAWEDAAEGDTNLDGGYPLDPADKLELLADPELAPPADALPPEPAPTLP
ncbi:MAG: S8 family serine peptidase [Actinomycetota bacterium]|nr:S8 family serine peptidase [Actinomycetota bacterium]